MDMYASNLYLAIVEKGIVMSVKKIIFFTIVVYFELDL